MCNARSFVQVGAVMLLCSALLVGCGSKVTQENFEKIHSGMTQAEVRAILGEPTESSGIALGPLGGTSSTWKSNGNTIAIQFLNDKVVAKTFSGKKP